jgi:hypothetical protein
MVGLRWVFYIYIDKNVIVYIELRYRVVINMRVWLLYFKMLMVRIEYILLL